jgi:ferredoxin--NADP+ reductase
MNKILSIRKLAENVNEYVIEAPEVAKNARAGQFIILRVDEEGERVPFTICDMDKQKGTITLLVQNVGYSTMKLAQKQTGDYIHDFTGPLGRATELEDASSVLLVGGGIGTAVIYPQAKHLKSLGKKVDVIIGARNKSLILYEQEFEKSSDNLYIATDDGSYGEKGFVTDIVKRLLEANPTAYDVVFAVGPLVMMRAVSAVTKPFGVHTVVSMNSIMVDGTGMCGGCRLTVGGQTKYACVDGPEFDGHKVDFDEAINRSAFYKQQEYEHICRLTGEKR